MIDFKKIINKSNDWQNALKEESDRGLVLIIQESINDELEKMHLNKIYQGTNNNKKIAESLVLNSFSPIYTFAARIKLAYAYGLIDKPIYNALEILRKIRNQAAHSSGTFSLRKDHLDLIYEFIHLFTLLTDDEIQGPFKSIFEEIRQFIEKRSLSTDQEVRKVFIFTAELIKILMMLYNIPKLKRKNT